LRPPVGIGHALSPGGAQDGALHARVGAAAAQVGDAGANVFSAGSGFSFSKAQAAMIMPDWQ